MSRTAVTSDDEGILSDMASYFRRRYLLARLRDKAIEGAMNGVVPNIGGGDKQMVFKETFLKFTAERYFFVFKRSERARKKRMHKDEQIIEVCTNHRPQLIEQRTAEEKGLWNPNSGGIIQEVKQFTPLIRVTGDGEDFANWIDFLFVHLPARYKWLAPIFLTVCAAVWLYWLKEPFCTHLYIFDFFHVCKALIGN